MDIEIDPESVVPMYQQIRDRIVESIAAGQLPAGEQLASVRQLALEFGINVQTVSKAYEALRREGLIRTNHKSGSVIARGPADSVSATGFVDEWSSRLSTLFAEAIAQGVTDAEIEDHSRAVLASFASRRAGTGAGSTTSQTEGS